MSRIMQDLILPNEEKGIRPEYPDPAYDEDQERLSKDEGYFEFLARLQEKADERYK